MLLLTFWLLLLPLWEAVIVLCFAVRWFMSILVLQSSLWRRESWLLCLICLYWCLVMVERLFLEVPCGCLRFWIVLFPDHTHLVILFLFSLAGSILAAFASSKSLNEL